MKKLNLFVLCLFCGLGVSWALPPSPMESVAKYNVILVHGAADSSSGFIAECGGDVYDAYTLLSLNQGNPDSNSWKLGGATGMFGSYHERMEENSEKLTNWLDSAVFEDYSYKNGLPYIGSDKSYLYGSSVIYIQRSFSNPAESPAHNAHEIGDRTWKGNNKCSVRRSLFEEAQEVRAGGQDSLRNKRESQGALYRTIPSRNILIAHSMGGVASHEYVTDTDVYNNDVDKVIFKKFCIGA